MADPITTFASVQKGQWFTPLDVDPAQVGPDWKLQAQETAHACWLVPICECKDHHDGKWCIRAHDPVMGVTATLHLLPTDRVQILVSV